MIYALGVIREDFDIELGLQSVPGWRRKQHRSPILLMKMHILCAGLQFISYTSAFVLLLRIP